MHIIDLLLINEHKDAMVADNRTAAQPMSQKTADDDNQMTSYAYPLASNKYVFPTAPVKCRFKALRKLKSPKWETVHGARTALDRILLMVCAIEPFSDRRKKVNG